MTAFLFPGQGAQRSGMGSPWTAHPAWSLVQEASDVTGRDVQRLLIDAEDAELTETRNAQLATFVLSMVAHRAVGEAVPDLQPTMLAGHSLGEYSALTAAGVLDFQTAAQLVAARGEAMQAAVTSSVGTMGAVLGLADEAVEEVCAGIEGAWVANYNAPGQVVIAGELAAIDAASAAAKEAGAKRVMPLPVAGAFHTPLMASAQSGLDDAIAGASFTAGAAPVWANVDAAAHTEPGDWSTLLSQQLCSPVRWSQLIATAHNEGCTTFIEIGPGAALTGMVKRTAKETTRLTINGPDDLDAAAELSAP